MTLAPLRALAGWSRPGLVLLAVACAAPPPVPADTTHVPRDSTAPSPEAIAPGHRPYVPEDSPAPPAGASALTAASHDAGTFSVPKNSPSPRPAPGDQPHVPEDSQADRASASAPGPAAAPAHRPAETSTVPGDSRSPPADVPAAAVTPGPAASSHVPGDSRPRDAPPPAPKASSPVPPPPGLVDLRAELPDACFDVRYATADNFTGAVLPGYAAPGAWLRRRPADALARVQAAVSAEGLTLLVYDAYRPARASLAMVEWAERSGRRQLVDDGYIARRSGHNRGDTVDLGLARAGTCEPLDMGTAWDHLGPASHYARAAGDALAHRRLLRRAMQAQGFVPYDKEWWHFSFRDPDAVALDIPYDAAP
ncbi:M15 family metallopeptidase [Nannocystis exedens]|uniref:M15 family metallopeptidase n=1 Tax=Nannocystis exedens TaxID=54 RepID=UPI001B80C3F4|nr:M15 family metallopeptidase [Nannocystis exedens]